MPAINCVGDTLNISIDTKPHSCLWLLAPLACALPKLVEKAMTQDRPSDRDRDVPTVIKAASLTEVVSSQRVTVFEGERMELVLPDFKYL